MTTTTTTPAHRTKRAQLPADFGTQPHRLHGTAIFESAIGVAPSTFARFKFEKRVPEPDVRMGRLNKYRESTILRTMTEGVA